MRDSCLLLVFGTRPEAIKLAPLAAALTARGHRVELALTGQHPHLDPADYGMVDYPLRRLHCSAGADPAGHAGEVAIALQPYARRADIVIVQGDTSSAFGGALGAEAAGVPLAHLEAGLRSFDLCFPWPEEGFRIAIDRIADLLFSPTAGNAANLMAEAVSGEIHVTGNTSIDALFSVLEELPPPMPDPVDRPRLLVTCHRRENWGTAFAPIGLALLDLAHSHPIQIDVVLHSNPAMADSARILLGGQPSIRLLPPLGHSAMIGALRSATLALSDSGGIQEEAPTLGVPLLVLRSRTERQEGVDCGNSRLVGANHAAIVSEVERLLTDRAAYRAMATIASPFGDGHSAVRIARRIEDWLVRNASPQRLIA